MSRPPCSPCLCLLVLIFMLCSLLSALPQDFRIGSASRDLNGKPPFRIDTSINRCGERNRLEVVCNAFCVKNGLPHQCINTELEENRAIDPYVPDYYYMGKRSPSAALLSIGVLLGESFFDMPRKWKCDCQDGSDDLNVRRTSNSCQRSR